jgi:DMSO/TMAO reductase YedYZ molybdopterin-dependent catalytic subunit
VTINPDSTRAAARPQGSRPAHPYVARGILTGLLAAAAALGTAQLVAGITRPAGSPVLAVGRAVIDLTPRPVTDFVIKIFGPHDKVVLLTTIVVLLAVFAAAFGVATMRRRAAGYAGLAIFPGIALLAVVTRPDFTPSEVIPTLVGAAVGAYALTRLAGAAVSGRAAGTRGTGPGGTAPAPSYGRRSFMATSAVTAVGAAAGGVVGNLLSQRSTVTHSRALVKLPPPAKPLPPLAATNDLRIPGLSPFLTPNGIFYRVDTALFIPQVQPASWRLRVHGMVRRELDITFDDLLRRPLTEADITLCCVSNPVGGPYISCTRWLGVSLAGVLREAGIQPGADQLLSTSTDGYTSGTPVVTVMDGRNALLAVAMDGAPLPVAHGFPARMVVPGLYGYVSATKWVTDIKVTTFAAEQGYWVQQGWAEPGPIKTESRIDVPNGGATLKPGRVAVAGVAWAQHRGVAAVEVRVDGGSWQRARLATVPGIDTWRQWVWDWDATAGTHQLQVRATDENGYTQTPAQAAPYPDGATGYDSVGVSVSG